MRIKDNQRSALSRQNRFSHSNKTPLGFFFQTNNGVQGRPPKMCHFDVLIICELKLLKAKPMPEGHSDPSRDLPPAHRLPCPNRRRWGFGAENQTKNSLQKGKQKFP